MNQMTNEIEVIIRAQDVSDLTEQLISKLTTSPDKQDRIRAILFSSDTATSKVIGNAVPSDEEIESLVWEKIPDEVKKEDLETFTSAMYVVLSENRHSSKDTGITGHKLAYELRSKFPEYNEWSINRLSHGAIFAGEALKKKGLVKVRWEGEDEDGARLYWAKKKIEDLTSG